MNTTTTVGNIVCSSLIKPTKMWGGLNLFPRRTDYQGGGESRRKKKDGKKKTFQPVHLILSQEKEKGPSKVCAREFHVRRQNLPEWENIYVLRRKNDQNTKHWLLHTFFDSDHKRSTEEVFLPPGEGMLRLSHWSWCCAGSHLHASER